MNHFYIGLNIGCNFHKFYWSTNPKPVKKTPVFELELKQRIAATDILKMKRVKSFTPFLGKYIIKAKMQQTIKPNFYENKKKLFHNAFVDFYFGKFVYEKTILGVSFNYINNNTGNIPSLTISLAPEVHYSLYRGWYFNCAPRITFGKTNVKYLISKNKFGLGTFIETSNNCLVDVCFFTSYSQFYGTFKTGRFARFQNIIAGGLKFRYHFIL